MRQKVSWVLLCLVLVTATISRIFAIGWKTYDFHGYKFSISLPEDWMQIPESIVSEYVKKMHELYPSMKQQYCDLAFQLSSAKNYFASPNILIQIHTDGKIAGSELNKIDKFDFSDEDIQNMKEATNGFIKTMEPGKMTYDQDKKIVWLKSQASAQAVGEMVSITGMCLTNTGWIQVICSAAKEQYSIYEETFIRCIESVTMTSDLRYTDDKPVFSVDWLKALSKGLGVAFLGLILFGVKLISGFFKKKRSI